MQTALTFVAILTMAMLLLCGTQPAFIFSVVLAVVSAVCRIMVSFILRKRTDEKNTKDAVLQKKIANWRKVRRRQEPFLSAQKTQIFSTKRSLISLATKCIISTRLHYRSVLAVSLKALWKRHLLPTIHFPMV